jgi:hypothetical protein
VQIQGAETLWTDHLSLLKLDGSWMIVHKTFTPTPLA